MSRRAAAALALATAWAAPAHAVVGGTDDAGDPAVVSLQLGGFPDCSGTLIGARTVLTAGHCVIDVGVPVTAVTGEDASDPSATFDVVESVRHPGYTGEGNDDDVALFELDRDTGIVPLALSRHAFGDDDVGAVLRHVGYGVSDEASGGGRGTRRSVDTPITKVTATLLFSGAPGKQTCDGDSGGPGLFVDDDGVERVASIVSDGPNCHDDGWDMRVDAVRAFIDDTLARFEPKSAPEPSGCAQDSGATAATLLSFVGALRLLRRRARLPRAPRVV